MSEKTATKRKPKSSQIPFALVLLVGLIFFGNYLFTKSPNLVIALILGLAFGYILQRSRFCFTAGFRDPWLTGSTSITRAVILAIALATIGFFFIKYKAFLAGAEVIPGNAHFVNPIGISLLVGGVMFGIGMVIAGGCASGTLMRVGEGFQMQIISLIFFVLGSLWGVHDLPFWNSLSKDAPRIFLPDYFGWFGALAVQFALLGAAYFVAIWWQKKKMGSIE